MMQTKLEDVQRLHESAVIIDMHSDIPADVVKRRGQGEKAGVFGRVHAQGWREGGMDGAVVTVGGDQLRDPSPFEYARRAISLMREEEAAGDVIIVTEAGQLLPDAKSDCIRLILNCEGGSPIEGSLEKLHMFHDQGLRFMTITWSAKNELGVGVGAGPGGLTAVGKSVVREMAKLGMVADVSHASVDGFWDCLRLDTGNVVATHSNAMALKDSPRNLTDDQLKALADQGGVIGVMAVPDFLHGESPGLSEVVDHIAYIADKVGVDHVGIGFDLFDFLSADEYRDRMRLNLSNLVKLERYPNYIDGLEGVRTTPELTKTLVDRGFASEDIRGILGGNIVRAWERIEARSAGQSSSRT